MIPELIKCQNLDEIVDFYEVMLRKLTEEVSNTCMQKQIPLPEAMSKICSRLEKVSESVKTSADEIISMWNNMKGKEDETKQSKPADGESSQPK